MLMKFSELRAVKDSLPHGSVTKIASQLSIPEDSVRGFFGGDTRCSEGCGLHIEKGPYGAIVDISDTRILDMAKSMIV